jgi:hypothetical protein
MASHFEARLRNAQRAPVPWPPSRRGAGSIGLLREDFLPPESSGEGGEHSKAGKSKRTMQPRSPPLIARDERSWPSGRPAAALFKTGLRPPEFTVIEQSTTTEGNATRSTPRTPAAGLDETHRRRRRRRRMGGWVVGMVAIVVWLVGWRWS